MLQSRVIALSLSLFASFAFGAKKDPEPCEAVAVLDPQLVANVAFFNATQVVPYQGKPERFHFRAAFLARFMTTAKLEAFRQERLRFWQQKNLLALERLLKGTRTGRGLTAPQINIASGDSTPLLNIIRYWRRATFWNPYTRKLQEETTTALPFVQKLISEAGAIPTSISEGIPDAITVALKEKDFAVVDFLCGLKLEKINAAPMLTLAIDVDAPTSTLEKLLALSPMTFETLMKSIALGRLNQSLFILSRRDFSTDELSTAVNKVLDHQTDNAFMRDAASSAKVLPNELIQQNPNTPGDSTGDDAHIASLAKEAILTRLLDLGGIVSDDALHRLFQTFPHTHPVLWQAITGRLVVFLLNRGSDPNRLNIEGRSALGTALLLDGLVERIGIIGNAHYPNRSAKDPATLIEILIESTADATPDSDPELIDLAVENALPWAQIEKLIAKGYRPTPNALARFYSDRSTWNSYDLNGLRKFFEFFPDFEINYATLLAAARAKFPSSRRSKDWSGTRLEIFRELFKHGATACSEITKSSELLILLNQQSTKSHVAINKLLVEAGAHYGIYRREDSTPESPIVQAATNGDWASVDYFLDLPYEQKNELDEVVQRQEKPFNSFEEYCLSLRAPNATLEKLRQRKRE